jgi:general secretion pathway protein C
MSPRRSIRTFAIAALALSAWFQARGVSALVGARLGAVDVTPRVVAQADVPPPPPPRNADIILDRNPFDSVTGSLLGERPASENNKADCTDVRVLAIAASDDPLGSIALLRYGDEIEPRLVGLGGDVVAMNPGAVLLDRSGVRCVARLFRPSVTTGVARSPVHPATAATRPGVQSTGAGSFAIDRDVRDELFRSAADWMKSISVRPEKVGDDVVGLRIVAIRPGSPIDGLGVRAGDVLQSLNGIALNLPRKLAEALDVLTTASRLSVVIVRDGRPMQLDYAIR